MSETASSPYAAVLKTLSADFLSKVHLPSPRMVVAIPARDEAGHIDTCLAALALQQGVSRGSFGVMLLVNNATDATASEARRLAPALPFQLVVMETELEPGLAHAGAARGLVMDLAALWLLGQTRGLILTTDADTRVAPDWMAATLAAIDDGADAVAGQVDFVAEEAARLPSTLRRRIRLEATLGRVLTELSSRIDPRPHNPWPRHARTSGASFAVTRDWYLRIGGVPLVPLGEDRALADRLEGAGARLRHAPEVRVTTSARLQGRAAGGTADTIRRQARQPWVACDPDLEPVWAAMRRARRQQGLRGAARTPESGTAVPRRRALRPFELPIQIAVGKIALFILRSRDGAAGRGDTSLLDAAKTPAQTIA